MKSAVIRGENMEQKQGLNRLTGRREKGRCIAAPLFLKGK
jgi:hypothetical protein